jgi:uncharacterized membrane protein
MLIDLAVALVLWLSGFVVFGRFISPRWKIGGKLVFYLAVTALLSAWVGHWSLIWVIGHPALGVGGHIWWCRKHDINWLTCEPRDRYLAIRPWAEQDGLTSREKA